MVLLLLCVRVVPAAGGFAAFTADFGHVLTVAADGFPSLTGYLPLPLWIHGRKSTGGGAFAGAAILVVIGYSVFFWFGHKE